MPQPLRSGTPFAYSVNTTFVADHLPKNVMMIGLVAMQWTRTEGELTSMVAAVFGQSNSDPNGGWGINPNYAVESVIRDLETIRVRLKIISGLLEPLFANALDRKEEWKELSEALNKRARERNRVVHSVWGWSETYPDKLIEVSKAGDCFLWSENDLVDVHERMKKTETDLHFFMKRVLGDLETGRIRHTATFPKQP